MILKTERLTLRPFTMRDLKTTHAYASDPENTPYMIHFPNKTIWETRRHLKKVVAEWKKKTQRLYNFAVELDGTHIGSVNIWLNDAGQGSLGWMIQKTHWGRGYATEATKAVMDFARAELNITTFTACCDHRNTASRRVMEKLGMARVRETVGRGHYKHGPEEEIRELTYTVSD